VTVTPNAAIAPNGATTADKISEGGLNQQHEFYLASIAGAQQIPVSTYAIMSIYAKADERHILSMHANSASDWAGAIFDIEAGTVTHTEDSAGDVDYIASSITHVGDGWYRCTLTFFSTVDVIGGFGFGTNNNPACGFQALGASDGYLGVVGYGLYVWGPILELGQAATGYWQNTSTVNARAADVT
jgi:hypothetical protein